MVIHRFLSSFLFLIFFSVVFGFWQPEVAAAENSDVSNPDITKAVWMWNSADGLTSGGGEAFFRYKLRPESAIKEATLLITADNGYELYINNRKIAEEISASVEQWGTVERYRVEKNLVPKAANCIAIHTESLGGSSGLLVAVKIVFEDGQTIEKYSGDDWICTTAPKENWWEPDHDDSRWQTSVGMVPFGGGPWGKRLTISPTVTDPDTLKIERPKSGAYRSIDSFTIPSSDFVYPAGVVFIEGRAPDNSTPLATTNFRIGQTRAYWENDVPAPSISGNRLVTLIPASPEGKKTTILDAGNGLIGSPVCSDDGKTLFFCMAPEGKTFFHLYKIDADGTHLTQLTDGKFHDTDPCVLPDGTIVFSSTRTGARDEYHANVAHSIFRLNIETGDIRPITYHITADSDPEVMADGRIVFVRHDNFLERAKVETHLHCVRPDGTAGEILIGPDRGAVGYDLARAAERDGAWLRVYGFGSPAPLPNGQLAALSQSGLVITQPRETAEPTEIFTVAPSLVQPVTKNGIAENGILDKTAAAARLHSEKVVPYNVVPLPCNVSVIDISALPDNRILVSTARKALAVLNPETGEAVRLHQSTVPVHSVVYLGPKTPVRVWPSYVDETLSPSQTDTTGYLYCADVFQSKQTAAEWARVRAARVFAGDPMRMRSARHQYGHVGTVGVELGTFPLVPDGSFYIEVPADTPLAIQAVDAEGRPVVNEISWIYTRPNEFRSCVGCHADRTAAPNFGAPPLLAGQPISLIFEDRHHPKFRANNGANGAILNLQLDRMRETISVDLYPDIRPRNFHHTQGSEDKSENTVRPPKIPEMVSRLHHELGTSVSEGQRFAAVQRLSILRPQDEATRTLLCHILKTDTRNEVRMAAAMTLATCAKPDCIPTLLAALEDTFEPVGHAAHLTLEHITGNTAFDSRKLRDISLAERKTQWEKWFAANSPEKIEADHVEYLKKIVNTKSVWSQSEQAVLYRFVVESLAHVGTEKSAVVLRNILANQWKEMDLLSRMTTIRTLGYLNDTPSIPLLSEILMESCQRKMPPTPDSHEFGWTAMPDHTGGAVVESLCRIALASPQHTTEIETILINAFQSMSDFWFYTFRIADHDWLRGSVTSILHARIIEALDSMKSTRGGEIADKIIRSIPIDSDRGMLLDNDVYETTTCRVLHRSGVTAMYLTACLDFLEGKEILDTAVKGMITASPPAVSTGALEPTSRAAHLVAVLAWDCEDDILKKRVRELYELYRSRAPSRDRSWVCFMLARAIGRLRDTAAIPYLVSTLKDEKREFDFGSAPPPNVFLHEAMTPVHRAAAANALGEIGDTASLDVLLDVIMDFDNAMDVRDAAAVAIRKIATHTRTGHHPTNTDTLENVTSRNTAKQRDRKIDAAFIGKFEAATLSYPELYVGKTMYDALRIMRSIVPR